MAISESSQENVRSLQLPAAFEGDERELWKQLRTADTPESLRAIWLALQCAMLDGIQAGLLFLLNESEGRFEPAATWPAGHRPKTHLLKAAEKALAERRALALQLDPQGESAAQGAVARTVVAQIIESGGQLLGVAVLDVDPRPPEELERLLRRLGWGIPWIELSFQDASSGGGRAAQLDTLLDILAVPLEHDRFRASASAFVTELSTRLNCDRVSFGIEVRGDIKLCAVSHTSQFSERANLSRAIESVMEEAFDQETSVVWPSPISSDAPPQITHHHQLFAEESGVHALLSVPVIHGSQFCGVVLLERNGRKPFLESERELAEVIVDLAGPMLHIQHRDDRWIGAKILDALRESAARLVGPGHVAAKLVAVALVVVFFMALLVKGDYRVVADAEVEARILRASVAPFDGYISHAPARPGDLVVAGQLLAKLDDRDLVLEEARSLSEVAQLTKEMRQAMAERNAAKVHILSARLEQASAHRDLARSQLAKAEISAPFDGQVVTGDLSQKLHSPVRRGELLFEVAPAGEYRIAVEVDESEIDEVQIGQRGELVFSAFPNENFGIEVSKITPVSETDEGQNFFRVEATLDSTPPRLQPGMEGIAKIEVDRRRLIWIWTHDVIDWFRLTLWRWTP